MLPIKDRVKILSIMYPLNERTVSISIDLKDEVYKDLNKMASDNEVTMDELMFMIVLEYIEEHII